MEKYNLVLPKELTINSVIPIIESQLFEVNIQGYKPFAIYFIEIESFIEEYDFKLSSYLSKFNCIKDKIEDAIDIGYDFEDMIADYVKNLVEYQLIKLLPETEL